MIVLGVETSCDETSVAVLRDGAVLSDVISSQHVHAVYGGVVPELASRAHMRVIIEVVEEALRRADVRRDLLDGIAVTRGPGLVGALLVGLSFSKAMAFGLGIPLIGVNHMEGHLYSPFLAEPGPTYPFLALIVSGGHTMLVHVREPFRHDVLGETRDDAAGEAFDKVAKMLGLGYPGGPVIDRLAKGGNPEAIRFPRSLLEGSDFSFSGIKTAVLYYLRRSGIVAEAGEPPVLDEKALADVCASFQMAVVDVLVLKAIAAAEMLNVHCITMSGGVSANSLLRERMTAAAAHRGYSLHYPSLDYCTDNGAMIAYVGWMRLQAGQQSSFDLPASATLPLGLSVG
jgi:N6-L-threonylcarbamoyladenine synthase